MTESVLAVVVVISAITFIGLVTILVLSTERCRHEWSVIVKSRVPPLHWSLAAQDLDASLEARRRAEHGATVVLLTCRRCGKVREKTLPGHAEPARPPERVA